MECSRLLLEHLEFLSGIRDLWKVGSLWGMTSSVEGVRKSEHQSWVPTGPTVNKKYYVEVLREFRKRFCRKRPALFKSGQWHFHQDNAPVHNSILVTDYLTKMDNRTIPHSHYSPDLAPCDFWLFPRLKEKAVVMRQLRRWKRLWRKSLAHSQKRTSMNFPEVVGTVQQVHFSRRKLIQRGLEIHVCTINRRAHTKKVRKLIEGTSYIYIEIYIYIYSHPQIDLFRSIRTHQCG